jgi:hypothetical protein
MILHYVHDLLNDAGKDAVVSDILARVELASTIDKAVAV